MGFLGDTDAFYGDDTTKVTDIINGGGVEGFITVGLTSVVARVGGSNLTNRVSLTVHNNGAQTIFWGYNSGVTITTGTPIFKGQMVFFSVGVLTNIYLISGTAAQNVRITEGAL